MGLFSGKDAMKLGPFISGVFGTVGFTVSVLAGIETGNSIESVLTRGLLSAGICYGVGYFVGLIAQQVALEHAHHVSKVVAAEDAAKEQRDREALAEQESELAQSGPAPVVQATPANKATSAPRTAGAAA
jgi:hypothetical protein